MKFALILATLALFFSSPVVRADGVTVSTTSVGWVQIAPNTFVLPANLGVGLGPENEPIDEPNGAFNFNVALAGVPDLSAGQNTLNLAVLDPDASASDHILVGNFNGRGLIFLDSDPFQLPGPANGVLCTETDNGCVASFDLHTATGSTVTVTAAFDGEKRPFEPFGVGFDTTDGIQFTGTGVPEPGSLSLLASAGLVGLAGMLRKKCLSL